LARKKTNVLCLCSPKELKIKEKYFEEVNKLKVEIKEVLKRTRI